LTDTHVVISDDAIEQLADAVGGDALVVADRNTFEAAGERVVRALRDPQQMVFPQRTGLTAGPGEVRAIRQRGAGCAELIAVGSGVVTDIVRYAAHMEERDFISVPTAASMDGYASGVAALQLHGVKVTYPARPPRAIFADPSVLAAAPSELTRAGIGDLLAKAAAAVDWLAAHLLYGEPHDEKIAARVREPMLATAANVDALLCGGTGAAARLLGGLIESGTAMALAGSSRPASGCEHHASHFWDLLAARGRRRHCAHGLQVGYATRFALRLQRFAFTGGIELPRPPVPPKDPLGPAALRWLGEPTEEIVAAVRDKQRFTAALPASWPETPERWSAVRARLAPAIARFAEVERGLEQAGIPAEPGFLDLDRATLTATFRYATRLRSRYTTLDFLEGQRALDAALEAALYER
jgi:glycerol-1-phosphate dehydrogenase [NAD(P)+]